MDYEKKYKEALENARQEYNTTENVERKRWLEELFSELKESEDELKWLTLFIQEEAYYLSMDIRGDEDRIKLKNLQRSLAWLEKQGKGEYALKSYNHEDVLKFMEYIEKRAKAYDFNLPHRGYDIYAFAKDILCYLEKQGEQKPLIEMKSPEESLGISIKEFNEVVNDSLYGESKSADKVELKFKVGDWVTNELGYPWYIYNIDNKNYQVYNEKETYAYFPISNQDKMRIWTTQDAKDGDVLVDKDDNIGIFQECLGLCWHSYIYLGCDGQLYGFNIGGSHEQINTNACPATKEQRDLLFKKMKDAGYKFDFDKKELKKVN